MKSSVPVYISAPMEYRVALDIASVWLGTHQSVKLLCEQPALVQEAEQRLDLATQAPWLGGLWLEPQNSNWKQGLLEFSNVLSPENRLAVLLSLPDAGKLPERRDWTGGSLGEHPGGVNHLINAIQENRFSINAMLGLHSGQAVILNIAARYARKLRLFAMADRLEFSARKQYIKPLSKTWRSTCAILLTTKQ